jgi:hypothetical protein
MFALSCRATIYEHSLVIVSLVVAAEYTMITTRTTALIAAMSLLGTVAPAAFAQNTSVNTDDDAFFQAAEIKQAQLAANEANVATTKGDDNIVAGNNAVALRIVLRVKSVALLAYFILFSLSC